MTSLHLRDSIATASLALTMAFANAYAQPDLNSNAADTGTTTQPAPPTAKKEETSFFSSFNDAIKDATGGSPFLSSSLQWDTNFVHIVYPQGSDEYNNGIGEIRYYEATPQLYVGPGLLLEDRSFPFFDYTALATSVEFPVYGGAENHFITTIRPIGINNILHHIQNDMRGEIVLSDKFALEKMNISDTLHFSLLDIEKRHLANPYLFLQANHPIALNEIETITTNNHRNTQMYGGIGVAFNTSTLGAFKLYASTNEKSDIYVGLIYGMMSVGAPIDP